EFDGDRRHAHPARRDPERPYPVDRRLFELEFPPRPRQRDRYAGEVRLTRRPSRDPLREWCGNRGKGEDVVRTSIWDGRPNWTAAMVTRLHVGEVLGVLRKRFRPNYETVG